MDINLGEKDKTVWHASFFRKGYSQPSKFDIYKKFCEELNTCYQRCRGHLLWECDNHTFIPITTCIKLLSNCSIISVGNISWTLCRASLALQWTSWNKRCYDSLSGYAWNKICSASNHIRKLMQSINYTPLFTVQMLLPLDSGVLV